MLSDIHPGLERALGSHFDQKIAIELLATYGGPQGMKTANPEEIAQLAKQHAPKAYQKILAKITEALAHQTVIIPGTHAAEQVIRFTASQLKTIREQRKELETQFENILDDNPLGNIILSMPGIGVKLGIKILAEIADITNFPSARHLGAYAGLAPRTHRSGTSIKGEYAQHAGNKKLKTYLFRAAFASLADPRSRTYYDKKRAEGKTHNAAILCLARQRITTLYTMLTTQTPYTKNQPAPLTLTQAA